MLKRMQIGQRLALLIVGQTLILMLAGLITVNGLRAGSDHAMQSNRHLLEQTLLNQMNEALRSDLVVTISNAANEQVSWDQAQMDLLTARNLLASLWDEYQTTRTPQELAELSDSLGKHYELLMLSFTYLESIFSEQDKEKLASYQDTQLNRLVTPFILELKNQLAQQQLHAESSYQQATSNFWFYIFGSMAVMVLGLVGNGALGTFVYRSIAGSIKRISITIKNLAGGDDTARTGLSGADELSTLGLAFDHLLSERMTMLLEAQQGNERLNATIGRLVQAVSQLSRRDLTLKVPVSDDATGPLAEALNHFTDETAQVLIDMRRIAERVAKASVMVRTQSDVIFAAAANEQNEIDETSRILTQTADTFKQVAGLAQTCDQGGQASIEASHMALQSVAAALDSFNSIGNTIYEAEKYIKRLGEQADDLGRAIHLINRLADRAHILALNADMHAASAGEAGRGFTGVAGEVQRVAENARAVAQQFTFLVANIQSESGFAILTINDAIMQTATGRCRVEQAAEHLLHAKNTTKHLVDAVHHLTQGTTGQILFSTEMQERALSLQASIRKTHEQVQEQTQQTKRLVQYSKVMLSAVQVFTLPAEDEEIEISSTPSVALPVPLKMRAS